MSFRRGVRMVMQQKLIYVPPEIKLPNQHTRIPMKECQQLALTLVVTKTHGKWWI